MKVCVIGDVSYNTILHVDQFPKEKGTYYSKDTYEAIGSSAAGKAFNLSNLGHDVTLISRLGQDKHGKYIKSYFESWPIRTIWIEDSSRTMTHTNIMHADGSRMSIFKTVLDTPKGSYLDDFKAQLKTFDTLFVELSSSFQKDIQSLIHPSIWVDLHDYDGVNPFHEPYLNVATFYAFSLEETSLLEPITRKLENKHYLYTQGAYGATYHDTQETVFSKSYSTKDVVDTNGAGDAFISAFYTYMNEGYSARKALDIAHEYAAKVIQSKTLFPQ